MRNWYKLTRPWNVRVCIFQFPIDPKIRHKYLEKYYPKDELNKSTSRIYLIYFSMAQFNDKLKFHLRNLNINTLMIINVHVPLITNRLFRSFNRHSDKTVILSEFLQDLNNFSNKIVAAIRKSHEFSFKIVRVITIVVSKSLNFFLWMPSYDVRALPAVMRWRLAVESTFSYSVHPGCIYISQSFHPNKYIIKKR